MQPIVRMFVGSTWLDLQPERLAVEKALQRMRQTKLNGMEYFGSRDETTHDVSLKEVDRSDVYVGIIGEAMGPGLPRRSTSEPPRRSCLGSSTSKMTTDSAGRTRTEEANRNRLAAWKEELRKAHALGTGLFTSLDDLVARVTADLNNRLLDRYGAQFYLDSIGSLPFDPVQDVTTWWPGWFNKLTMNGLLQYHTHSSVVCLDFTKRRFLE